MGVRPAYYGLGPATGCTTLGIGNANQVRDRYRGGGRNSVTITLVPCPVITQVYQLSPQGCSICSWVYRGCWADNSSRMLPYQLSTLVASVDACEVLAEVNGSDTFALQSSGQCWAGVNPPFNAIGPGTACTNALGGAWSNMVS